MVLLWMTVLIYLILPSNLVKSAIDRLTKAKFRADRENLQIMLQHLQHFPEQWSIGRDQVSFPKEGSKQIYLTRDRGEEEWRYNFNSFDYGPRPLDGHFGKEFKKIIEVENVKRERKALVRNFYPDMDGPLLLGNDK